MNTRPLLIAALLTLCVAGPAAANGRWHRHHNNPPGPVGGPGTNWENPLGGAVARVRHRIGLGVAAKAMRY